MVRVDELERDREAKDACLRDMEQLNSKRQESLLATIDVLQEEVQNLTSRLGELQKDRSTGPCVCDEQKSRERNALVNPVPPTVVSPTPAPDVTPASSSAMVDDSSLGGETRKEQYLKKEKRSRKKQETQGPRDHVTVVDGTAVVVHSLQPTRDTDAGAPVRTYSSAVSKDESGFIEIRRRRNQKKPPSTLSGAPTEATSLKGSGRIRCKAYHLSGIYLDSSTDDVHGYCRARGVAITGCYELATRAWGTRSMKVYLDESETSLVLSKEFWPEHVKCREWLRAPPTGQQAASIQQASASVPEQSHGSTTGADEKNIN